MSEELDLDPESTMGITLKDVYKLFYILVAQNQRQRPGSKMAFDLKAFEKLPDKIAIGFIVEKGKLMVWIPEKRKRKQLKPKEIREKSRLYLPDKRIITTTKN